jgi:hypothetical protein
VDRRLFEFPANRQQVRKQNPGIRPPGRPSEHAQELRLRFRELAPHHKRLAREVPAFDRVAGRPAQLAADRGGFGFPPILLQCVGQFAERTFKTWPQLQGTPETGRRLREPAGAQTGRPES